MSERTGQPDPTDGIHNVTAISGDAADSQSAWRDRLIDAGLHVTDQKDRRYFRSIYVREPGGVLFEVATDGPGFTRDEDVAELGSSLTLPPWLEEDCTFLEERLPAIEVGGAGRRTEAD